MKKESQTFINLKIDEKDNALLKEIAKAKGNIPKSNVIRIAISEYIQRNKNLINEKGES